MPTLFWALEKCYYLIRAGHRVTSNILNADRDEWLAFLKTLNEMWEMQNGMDYNEPTDRRE